MKLDHIELKHLKPADLNVRKHGGDNVDDLLPSIRSLGIIQPLLVRKNCEGFEVIAGKRRLLAATILSNDNADIGPLPCAILEEGDDATAIEASLAENVARLPMDELDQFEAFKALLDAGRSAEDIAADFGVTERLVKQRLAIANLHPPILSAYRAEEIDAQTMRTLTLATKKQQKEWLRLFRDPKHRAPRSHQLKAWLFGGAEIPLSNALFDPEHYTKPIKGDLFGEERYFTDAALFWELQNEAIAERVEAYREAGWTDVVVMDTGQRQSLYFDCTKRSKKDGGKIFVSSTAGGEVEFHEGWIENKEAARLDRAKAKADGSYEPPVRTELTKAAQSYMDLHRHAAVRTVLLSHPQTALRLMVAHAIASKGLWDVRPQGHGSRNEAIAASLESCKADQAFDKERVAICKLLGIKERQYLTRLPQGLEDIRLDGAAIFAKLCELKDEQVMRILSYVMAETLMQGTGLIDTLGKMLAVDMGEWWTPDDAFYDLIRDKAAINAMLKEIGGKRVADGNVSETAKLQKQVMRNCLEGKDGRERVDGWLPRYLRFPQGSYLKRK